MKKLFMLFGLALAMLTVGCSTGLNEEATLNETVVIGVTFDEETRLLPTGIEGGKVKLGWSEGDVIYVNGVKSEPLGAAYEDKAEAKFFVNGPIMKPYNVIYAPTLVGKDGDVIIPEYRAYEEGGLGAVFAGTSETTAVSLKAANGFISFSVTGVPSATCDISIKAAGGELLSGNATVDFTTGLLSVEGGLPTIHFSGIPVDSGEVVGAFAVPAGAYANGFVVSVAAGETEMIKTIGATAGLTINQNSALLMPELTYAGSPRALTIKNASDLQAFLLAVDAGDYAAYVNGMGEVLLANDIDLTGVTLQGSVAAGAEASFKHTFNGQGHSLKNWTVTSPLFADNRGIVKNLVLDASCTWTPVFNGDQAMVVLKNNGVISGITSNVSVIIDGFDVEATTTLGPICARSYSPVLDCVNNGDLKFTNAYWSTGNIYLGGVVGYAWYAAGEVLMGNCVNNGDINIVCADGIVGKNIHIGGVLGSTAQNGYKTLTAEKDFGILLNCVNNGEVYVERKALDSGTYANVAGVAGYIEGDMLYCVNKGDVSYIVVNDNTGDKASTRPCVGGVAAVCTFSMKNCVNEGLVIMRGTFAAGGTSGETSGIGASGNPCFGGVAGQVGNHHGLGDTADGCINNGELLFDSSMRSANNTAVQIGGVFGLSNCDVLNCTNNGKFTIKQNFGTAYAGGVVGRHYQKGYAMTKCENNGDIDFTPLVIDKNTQLYIGGVAGHGPNIVVSDCANHNSIIVREGHSASANSYLGGIMGYNDGGESSISYSMNYGDMTILSSTKWRFGGIAGCAGGNITNCYHEGDLTAATNDAGAMGGVNGFGQANITNTQAYGTITGSASTPCGGLVGAHGNTAQNWNGNKIKVNIVAEGAKCGIFCGSNTAANEGKVSVIGDTEVNMVFGGMTINGVAVTEADCSDLTKLYGEIANAGFGILGEKGVRFIPAN